MLFGPHPRAGAGLVVTGGTARARTQAELASQAGFRAEPRAEVAAPTWQGIVDLADEIDAAVIVTGSRALTGVRELFEGSLSHELAEHARRPVLIVLPPGERRYEAATHRMDARCRAAISTVTKGATRCRATTSRYVSTTSCSETRRSSRRSRPRLPHTHRARSDLTSSLEPPGRTCSAARRRRDRQRRSAEN
jgi:hypothetical protein